MTVTDEAKAALSWPWRAAMAAWNVLSLTIARWTRNDGNVLAASMAYYAAFSFFPLLIVLLSAMGFALRFSASAQNARQQLLNLIADRMAPALASEVENILSQVQTRAAFSGPVALVILLFGAIGIFSQLDYAFDRLWHEVTPHERGIRAAIVNALWNRLRAFLTLVALGALLIVAFAADLALAAVHTWAEVELPWSGLAWPGLQWTVSVLLNGIVFTLVFKLMPRVRVRWLHAACGGLLVAVTWQVGSQLVSRFIVGGNYSAYGVVGSFIAIMLWVYYASILLFLGGQLVQVLGHPNEPGDPR
jgi:membrane protein